MREKFYRFMQGRYGVDQLYRFIFFLALVLMIINTFLRNPMLNLVVYALLILDIFRMLSKNHSARYAGKSEISAADCKIPLLAGSTEKALAGEKVSSYLHLSKM